MSLGKTYNLEDVKDQLKELFGKSEWTDQDYARLLQLLDGKTPADLQPFFQEEYIDSLTKLQPDDQGHARNLLQQIRRKGGIPEKEAATVPAKRPGSWTSGPWMTRTIYRRIAVAASFILLTGISAYFLFAGKRHGNNLAALSQQQRFKNDISPAKQQVILTLSDGTTRVLDSISNGTMTVQGNTQAIIKGGSMVYLRDHAADAVFNTITTEKGRTFHLQLADGTGVWLDALSSIHFPTAFTGADRTVEITGQAYFEVAKNAHHPFKVKSGNQVIEVLGTHFNINSYDRQDLQTTLLEGSVKVIPDHAARPVLLTPGQQTKVAGNGKIEIVNDANVEEVMAWKEGRFQFNGSSVEQIMGHISNWYNIDVVYKDKITETFVADIKRDLPVSKLLELLEMTKQVKFVIDGNKVTVMKW